MIDIGLMLMKLGAVLGGAVLGALGTRLVVALLVRLLTRRRMPRTLLNFFSALGAVVVGLLVWLWLFGASGSGGFGGGGGWWPFGGAGGGAGNNGAGGPTQRGPGDTALRTVERSAKINMLGGQRVQDNRFYVLEMDRPRTLTELKETLLQLRRDNPSLTEIEIVIYEDSVEQDGPAVRELVQWVEANGLKHKLSFPGTKAP
jgi:hypothetical protein